MLSEEKGVDAVAGTPKSSRRRHSHVIFVVIVAIARSSASTLEQKTAVCFLVFQQGRAKKNTIR
jgi:hypothetical protein